ncbi:MAG: RsmB/NOP family class I SAM-dependent RNA methyltransferase, partial [Roseobacter sp.]|jgi:16S rRNA (cytosine967-C5)-methyltransferase|nr:RsmB/NOP family class I SAM-dependent RNA methyltransferase [Roseobacter sp.]
MKDIPHRASRAGSTIRILDAGALAQQAPFDLVLCDAPCSGSGAWRRSPEAKWTFTPQALDALVEVQQDILKRAADLTSPSGSLVYATCSVLKAENENAVARFLDTHRAWSCRFERRINISTDGDGFYAAHLTRDII